MSFRTPDARGALIAVPGYMRTEDNLGPYEGVFRACENVLDVTVLPWDPDEPSVPGKAEQVVRTYLKLRERNYFLPIYFYGSSMGAAAIVLATQELEKTSQDGNVGGLFISSISPVFGTVREEMRDGTADRGLQDGVEDDWEKLQVEVRAELPGGEWPELHKPICLYYGEGEVGIMHETALEAAAAWAGYCTLTKIIGAGHVPNSKQYIDTITASAALLTKGFEVPVRDLPYDDANVRWVSPTRAGGETVHIGFTRTGGIVVDNGRQRLPPITLANWYAFMKDLQSSPSRDAISSRPLPASGSRRIRTKAQA